VVIGDTSCDPLKDLAEPSLNIRIKLQNILAIKLLQGRIKVALII